MIEAKELRVGNLVNTVTAGMDDGIQVSGIYEGKICFDDGDMFDPKYVDPIPLTPEILEKSGFAGNKGDYHFENIIFLRWTGRYFLAKLYVDASSFASSLRCELIVNDVHQLQNLFYAISGEELEINLQ